MFAGFNCTFMELKSYPRTRESGSKASFNCTFMELKFTQIHKNA